MGLFDLFKKKPKLSDEQLKMNKLWDMWVNKQIESPYKELMDYQSEVNNGGHSQYFTNAENVSDLQKDMSALDEILSPELKSNLHEAYKAYLIWDENDKNEEAEEVLERCDDVFWDKEDEINRTLENRASKIAL
ncbi:MAG: DUF4375 domain-containing protein [Clostridia bacterium]|nr:DUF4375 domain-containing protein [Clostridia bacterium]